LTTATSFSFSGFPDATPIIANGGARLSAIFFSQALSGGIGGARLIPSQSVYTFRGITLNAYNTISVNLSEVSRVVVPEPSSGTLLIVGIAGLVAAGGRTGWRRHKRQRD
jgi:hypothetical protein